MSDLKINAGARGANGLHKIAHRNVIGVNAVALEILKGIEIGNENEIPVPRRRVGGVESNGRCADPVYFFRKSLEHCLGDRDVFRAGAALRLVKKFKHTNMSYHNFPPKSGLLDDYIIKKGKNQ